METKHGAEWFWESSSGWEKVPEEDNKSLEEEWKSFKEKKRTSQIVYHCFGDKSSAIVDFAKMKTACGSGRCLLQHPPGKDHLSFKLQRRTIG